MKTVDTSAFASAIFNETTTWSHHFNNLMCKITKVIQSKKSLKFLSRYRGPKKEPHIWGSWRLTARIWGGGLVFTIYWNNKSRAESSEKYTEEKGNIWACAGTDLWNLEWPILAERNPASSKRIHLLWKDGPVPGTGLLDPVPDSLAPPTFLTPDWPVQVLFLFWLVDFPWTVELWDFISWSDCSPPPLQLWGKRSLRTVFDRLKIGW